MLISFYSCNTPIKRRDNYIEKSASQEFLDYNKTVPETDKNKVNDVWDDNVYRNKKYKFRVEFPIGWEYARGVSKTALASAELKEKAAVIVVVVSELSFSPKYPNNIFLSSPLESFQKDFNEVLALKNQKATDLKLTEWKLNNFPAYFIEYKIKNSVGKNTTQYILKQAQCYYKSKIYTIGLTIPEQTWSEDISEAFSRVIQSFTFEL